MRGFDEEAWAGVRYIPVARTQPARLRPVRCPGGTEGV